MDTNDSPSPARRRRTTRAGASNPAVDSNAAHDPAPTGGSDPIAAAIPVAGGRDDPEPLAGDDEDGWETRSGERIPEATLTSLDLEQGAIGRLDAQDVAVVQGAIGAARAERIEIEMGALGAGLANELDVTQGAIGTLLAGDAHLEQAVVRTIIAREVVVERQSLIGVLVARRVSGDVRVLFDWRGALVFGAVFGLLSRLGRRRR